MNTGISSLQSLDEQNPGEAKLKEALTEMSRQLGLISDTREDDGITWKVTSAVLTALAKSPPVYKVMELKLKPILDRTEYAGEMLSQANYRTNNEETLRRLFQSFNDLVVAGETQGGFEESIEELVIRETETWLDVAFIQACTGENAMATIGEISELASFFGGENSRVARRITRISQRRNLNKRQGLAYIAYGTVPLMLEALLARSAAELGTRLRPVILLFAILIIAFAVLAIRRGVHLYRNPEPSSRTALEQRYSSMKVPAKAQRFVETTRAIRSQLKRLEGNNSEAERNLIVQELHSLTAEANILLQENGDIFALKAGVEYQEKSAEVKIEELEKDPPLKIDTTTESEREEPDAEAEAEIDDIDQEKSMTARKASKFF